MDHLCFCVLCFSCLRGLSIAALWSPAGKGLTTSWLLVMFIVFLLLSHVVSWVRCGSCKISGEFNPSSEQIKVAAQSKTMHYGP